MPTKPIDAAQAYAMAQAAQATLCAITTGYGTLLSFEAALALDSLARALADAGFAEPPKLSEGDVMRELASRGGRERRC